MPAGATVPATAIIVVAAGSGSRLGHTEPKAFVPLAGRSILERSLDTVFSLSQPAHVVVVVPADRVESSRRLVLDSAGPASQHVTVVAGGASRQQSVAAGLAVVDADVSIVLVHDAARALTPVSLFDRVIAGVDETGAGVIPGLAVADTIKQTDASDLVTRTVDRSSLVAVQTPQGFPLRELAAAYESATGEFTDDAA